MSDFRNTIKQRYGFAAWPSGDDVPMFVLHWNYRPPLVPAVLGVERRQNLSMPNAALSADYHLLFAATSVAILSLGESEHHAHAREVLVDVLAGSMATGFPQAAERNLPVGEIAYASHRDPVSWVAFVRHNLTVSLQDVGENPIAIADLALQLDADLERWPAATAPQDAPRITLLELASTRVARGARVPLRFTYVDRSDARLSVRLRTTAGPIWRNQNQVFVNASRSGKHLVEMVLQSVDGRVAGQSVSLEIGP